MSAALELIRAVEANGGRLRVDGEYLVIAPATAAAPVMEGLRQHKMEIIGLLKSATISPHDPAGWREDFVEWMAENCIHRAGQEDSTGIGCLLISFAEWCIAHEAVPCQRAVFETLLEKAGFRCAGGMAAGLLLRVDLEAVLRFQGASKASGTPARAIRENLPPFGSYSSR